MCICEKNEFEKWEKTQPIRCSSGMDLDVPQLKDTERYFMQRSLMYLRDIFATQILLLVANTKFTSIFQQKQQLLQSFDVQTESVR